MTERVDKAVRGTIASFLQYTIFIILQIVLTPLVLQFAGKEVLGAYSILMQIIGLGILLDLGFSVALSRFLAQTYGFKDHREEFIQIFEIGRVFFLISNLLFSILVLSLVFFLGDFITLSEGALKDAKLALLLLAIWIAVRTPIALYGHALISTQNMAAANYIAILGNLLRLVSSIILVYFGYGLVGLVLANILSELVTFVAHTIYFKKLYPTFKFKWKISNWDKLKEILSFGMKYYAINIAVIIQLGSDSIIVGSLYSASAVAIYYTTKLPAFLIMQFVFRISDNYTPAINELYAHKNFQELREQYYSVLRYTLLLAIPVGIGILAFNEGVVSAWVGKEQFAGRIMTYALASFVISQSINHVNAAIITASGNIKEWSVFALCMSLLTLVFSYVLGFKLGMQWVMVGIAVLDILSMIYLSYKSYKIIKETKAVFLRKVLQPAILTSLLLIVELLFISINDILLTLANLVGLVLLYVILWFIGVYNFGLIATERALILNKIKKIYY